VPARARILGRFYDAVRIFPEKEEEEEEEEKNA
jgi:hypothetical protein